MRVFQTSNLAVLNTCGTALHINVSLPSPGYLRKELVGTIERYQGHKLYIP